MTKVLLVEDDESLRILYTRSLKTKNFDVETAVDGEDALAKARLIKPKAILLDITMPGMNGIEVLKILKADPELRKIPVLMLTGETDKIKECLEIGAKGYIMKGSYTSGGEIAKRVELLFALSQQQK